MSGLAKIFALTCILFVAAGCYRSHSARVATPPIVSAAQWGSQPETIPPERRHLPHRITVHHAGVRWNEGDDPVTRIANLQAWGRRERQWPDLPYHYLIAPDGRIFEGRPVEFQPETNTNYDTRGHIGVQLWGNFEEQPVTLAQLESATHLIAWLCDRHTIPPSTILGHRDVATGTVCPGEDLQRYIDEGDLRVWVAELIAGRTPDIAVKQPHDAVDDGGDHP